jgi:hypothetical protein
MQESLSRVKTEKFRSNIHQLSPENSGYMCLNSS